jgi:hypothetical protein
VGSLSRRARDVGPRHPRRRMIRGPSRGRQTARNMELHHHFSISTRMHQMKCFPGDRIVRIAILLHLLPAPHRDTPLAPKILAAATGPAFGADLCRPLTNVQSFPIRPGPLAPMIGADAPDSVAASHRNLYTNDESLSLGWDLAATSSDATFCPPGLLISKSIIEKHSVTESH